MSNNQGFALTEIIIAVGVASILSLVSYQLLTEGYKVEKKVNSAIGLVEIKQGIYEAFKNETSFDKTLGNPANAVAFNCINNLTDCAAAGGQINLYDVNNAIVRGSALVSTQDGLTYQGTACNSFSANGNDDCPFQYRIYWAPRCPLSGACINPLIKLSAVLDFKPVDTSKMHSIDVKQYEIHFNRTNKKASYIEACIKVGGTMISATQCQLGHVNQSCPPKNWIIGFSAAGVPICAVINGFRCPNGEVLLGVDAGGNAVCGPGCSSASNSSGSIW